MVNWLTFMEMMIKMIDKSKDFDKARKVSVIEDKNLSKNRKPRYVVIDKETNEILDDAQGYGYKDIKGAYAAWGYKTRDRSKDNEKAAKTRKIKAWMKENSDIIGVIDACAFDICKGSCDPDDKLDTALVKSILKDFNVSIDFRESELLKVYLKGRL